MDAGAPDPGEGQALSWTDRPQLNRPVLVAAFQGWNDAAEAATAAVTWLRHRWDARRFAGIDPDPYYDFQAVRPHVVLVDGVTRELRWPADEFFAASPGGTRDAVLLAGVEPNFRWRSFCDDVLRVADETSCDTVVTLGALLADVPHSRPVHLTGTAGDEQLARRLGIDRSRYEGPTGIVGVLHDACRRHGLRSISLWAPVPHYVASPPNPKATRALLDAVGRLVGAATGAAGLEAAVHAWEQRVAEAVAADPETAEYVEQLEHRADEGDEEEDDIPTGDDLVAELERFLRDESGGED